MAAKTAALEAALDGDIAKVAGLPDKLTARAEEFYENSHGEGDKEFELEIQPAAATYHWYMKDFFDMGQDMEYTNEYKEYGRIEVLAIGNGTMSFKLHSTGAKERSHCAIHGGSRPDYTQVQSAVPGDPDEVPSNAKWLNETVLNGTVHISFVGSSIREVRND